MKILIDNGHGYDTPGKCSPDVSLREWQWTREIARRVVKRLSDAGYNASLLVPEDNDVTLRQRVARANRYGDALVVSIHVNASGMTPQWRTPHGWCAIVAPNASLKSRSLAAMLAQSAEEHGLHVRKPKPDSAYWMQNLAICRDTRCPAVLTENLFMDNRHDCAMLLTDEGKDKIVDIHVNSIIKFLCSLSVSPILP